MLQAIEESMKIKKQKEQEEQMANRQQKQGQQNFGQQGQQFQKKPYYQPGGYQNQQQNFQQNNQQRNQQRLFNPQQSTSSMIIQRPNQQQTQKFNFQRQQPSQSSSNFQQPKKSLGFENHRQQYEEYNNTKNTQKQEPHQSQTNSPNFNFPKNNNNNSFQNQKHQYIEKRQNNQQQFSNRKSYNQKYGNQKHDNRPSYNQPPHNQYSHNQSYQNRNKISPQSYDKRDSQFQMRQKSNQYQKHQDKFNKYNNSRSQQQNNQSKKQINSRFETKNKSIEQQPEQEEEEEENQYDQEEYEQDEQKVEGEYDDNQQQNQDEDEQNEQQQENQNQQQQQQQQQNQVSEVQPTPDQHFKVNINQQQFSFNRQDEVKVSSNGQYIPLKKKPRHDTHKENTNNRQLADTMCPIEEFQDRDNIFKNYNKMGNSKLILDLQQWFAFFEVDKRTRKPTIELAIKRYRRSTGAETTIRSPQTLKKTIQHILRFIVDSDRQPLNSLPYVGPVDSQSIQYSDIYNFLWNRLRAIIIDITQMSQDLHHSKQCIYCLEVIARFYFYSINERRKMKGKDHVDQKMNNDRISQTLAGLLQSYKYSRSKLKFLISKLKSNGVQITPELLEKQMKKQKIYISPNEPEMLAYSLIYERDFSRLETFYEEFKQFSFNPLIDSQEIKLSIEVLTTMQTGNFNKFFQILESDRVNYLSASCMLHWIRDIRCKILESIHNDWKSSDTADGANAMSLNVLDQYLRFKGNRKELLQFINHVGGKLDSTNNYLLLKGFTGNVSEGYVSPYYQFESNKLLRGSYGFAANKNQNMSRQQILSGIWKDIEYSSIVVDLFRSNTVTEIVKKPVFRSKSPEKNQQVIISQKPVNKNEGNEQIQKRLKNIREKKKQKFYQNTISTTKGVLLGLISQQNQMSKIIFDKMFKPMKKWAIHFKKIGFNQIKLIIQQKLIKKRAFKAIKQAYINVDVWKSYLDQQDLYLQPKFKILEVPKQFQPNQDKKIQNNSTPTISTIFLKQQRFDLSLVSTIVNSQKGCLEFEEELVYRVLFLVNKQYLTNNFKLNYIRQIIRYIQTNGDLDWYDQFIASKGKGCYGETVQLAFQYQGNPKSLNLIIDIALIEFQAQDKRNKVKCVIQKQSHGADLIIMPMILQQDNNRTLSRVVNDMKQSDVNLLKLYFLIPIISSRPYQPISKQTVSQIPSCFHFYQNDSNMKAITTFTVANYLNSILQTVETKPTTPSLNYAKLSFQIGTIFKNMQFVHNQIKNKQIQYLYYEFYVQECLNQLIEATEIIYSNKQTIYNWKNIINQLLKLNDSEFSTKSNKLASINTLSNIELKNIITLLKSLKIKLVDRNYFYNTNKKNFVMKKSTDYFSQFAEGDQLQKFKQRAYQCISNNIDINSCQLPVNNIKDLFDNLLYGAIAQLQINDVYLILPSSFTFTFKSNIFAQSVHSKYISLLDSIMIKPIKIQNETVKNILSMARANKQQQQQCKRKFNYQHQDWVKLVKKKRNVQGKTLL